MNNKQKNITFFERELSQLLLNPIYKNKFVVIFNEQIVGSYDTFETALQFALSQYPSNEFIIQQVIDEKEQINFLWAAER